MGENTRIQWADHTFNPWRGCAKVSAGCKHCYAETLSKRNPAVLGEWGVNGKRAVAAESYWRKPLAWNRAAQRDGVRRRVFCASLGDVFEERPDLRRPRERLFRLIRWTPALDWLLLTKRPESVVLLAHEAYGFPLTPNVWLGTSVEDQQTADERIPLLLDIPATVRFVSYEPALGPVDWIGDGHQWLAGVAPETGEELPAPDWIIVGGESGPKARPFDIEWARETVKACAEACTPVFVKQFGRRPVENGASLSLRHPKGADPGEWPEDSRVRQFPKRMA